ncbi:MAG: DNA-3-methyladenine glycosylase 2 family protein [Planctomycetota bacterium]|nr:DNA-3-methyladenine glycosylase 2 family protein [Planctomycetota bacterium]MEC9233867.1 DNA-3-methyladenine glycosylase 2 family protein [Planctomycetota bacterium]MED5508602.1 DNA-3-methyladenine glycosylase 2 family protein [Planctomycetota bacterium]
MTSAVGQPSGAALRALARRDPALGRLLREVGPFPGIGGPRTADSHFHALARSIIYQQLAGRAAKTIHDRVRGLGRGRRFPTPPEVLRLPERRLRAAGLSKAKHRAIVGLARAVEDRTLPLRSIARLEDEVIIERLTRLHGIGTWTAEMFLMFRLGRLDVMPAGDLGVREGIRVLDRLAERPTPARVLERAEPWRPLRSVATWCLYRAADRAKSPSARSRAEAEEAGADDVAA